MACVYNFKGHTFNSELELDNFLIEKYEYYLKYGDIVFSRSTPLLAERKRLEDLRLESKEHWDAYLSMKRNMSYRYDVDGDADYIKEPYKGVTKYLSLKTGEDGKRLHPEFIDDEYWSKKFKQWEEGKFGETEQLLFGYKENDTKIVDLSTKESMKNQIIDKWKNQAAIGTAVHNVLLLYFTEIEENGERKYVFELSKPEEYILNHLEKENLPYINNNIKGTTIRDTIRCAKALHQALKKKFGEELLFFPEYVVYSEIHDNLVEKILGFVDLVVIDKKGKKHIIDYKTSIKNYGLFNNTKTLSYKYQMATYSRMLEAHDIDMYGSTLWVAPIKIDGFKKEGDKWVYEGISYNELYDDLTAANIEPIYENINSFLPPKVNFHISTDNAVVEISNWMLGCFPDYAGERDITEENTKVWLEKTNRLKKNDSGKYVFREIENKKTIIETDPVEFVRKVTEYRKNRAPARIRLTGIMKDKINEALELQDPDVAWPVSFKSEIGESVAWLKDTIAPYCNGEWQLYDNEAYEKNWGVITLVNKNTLTVDYIRISTNYLDHNHRDYLKNDNPTHGRIGLSGQFETDALANSKARSLMLESTDGNIELMEMMALLNMSEGHDNFKIGKMAVVNPYDNKMTSASNKELLYCFNLLNYFNPMKWNKFLSDEILMCSMFELALRLYKEVLSSHDVSDSDIFSKFKGCTSAIDNVASGSTLDKIKELMNILKMLESDSVKGKEFNAVYKLQGQLQQDHIRLYNTIVLAVASLKGVDFRQLIEDHGKWFQSILIHSKGLQGSYIDNPGNLSSETLNLVTLLVTEAYLNTRDDVMREKKEIDKLVKAIKLEANFGYLQENLGFNLADLYKDMFEERDDDLVFKHPEELSGAKRAFLEYALKKINEDRYGEEAQILLENNDPRYYRAPIAMGSKDSTVSYRGWLAALREKLKEWNPKTVFERTQKKVEGLNYYDNAKEDKTFIFKMTNMFDCGNESINSLDKRLTLIKDTGIQNLERNVETLLLKHIFAYSQQRNIDLVFPLIKASAIHLLQLGAMLNTYFLRDLDYFKDYVWNKVLNRTIVSKLMLGVTNVLNYIKQAASKFSLAFSPVQAIYQTILGLWQDISLMIRKPDGKESFTFNHFRTAFKMAFSDLFNFTGNPTLCSRLNELYALNDMDMNSYIDRITKNRKGVYNFDNMMFKFASRPDYYNRMTIFLSQMQGDGCLEAHYMEDGELKYDCTKDKRFDAFFAGNTSDPRYNQQKSLYYAIATLFVNEHAKNPDGTEFTFNINDANPAKLPRAYTNKLAEGMKSLADDIYGYYSHEKKSLIMSTTLGSLWLQFKTFWSGKKNQYLQSGGIRTRGSWEHYTEKTSDGREIKWYYQTDTLGNIQYDLPPIPDLKPTESYSGQIANTEEKKIAPVMLWKGLWLEGILLSVTQTLRDRHIVKNFKDSWNNPDTNLQRAYRSNIKQLGYDMFMFFVIGSLLAGLLGDWLKEVEKDNKKSTEIADGLKVAAFRIAVLSVKNSFLDLNMFSSIGEPIGQWTPFSFLWMGKTAKRFYNAAIGNDDWYDTVVRQLAVGNQIKPLFDVMKPESFRTKQEGGTWESRRAKLNKE